MALLQPAAPRWRDHPHRRLDLLDAQPRLRRTHHHRRPRRLLRRASDLAPQQRRRLFLLHPRGRQRPARLPRSRRRLPGGPAPGHLDGEIHHGQQRQQRRFFCLHGERPRRLASPLRGRDGRLAPHLVAEQGHQQGPRPPRPSSRHRRRHLRLLRLGRGDDEPAGALRYNHGRRACRPASGRRNPGGHPVELHLSPIRLPCALLELDRGLLRAFRPHLYLRDKARDLRRMEALRNRPGDADAHPRGQRRRHLMHHHRHRRLARARMAVEGRIPRHGDRRRGWLGRPRLAVVRARLLGAGHGRPRRLARLL